MNLFKHIGQTGHKFSFELGILELSRISPYLSLPLTSTNNSAADNVDSNFTAPFHPRDPFIIEIKRKSAKNQTKVAVIDPNEEKVTWNDTVAFNVTLYPLDKRTVPSSSLSIPTSTSSSSSSPRRGGGSKSPLRLPDVSRGKRQGSVSPFSSDDSANEIYYQTHNIFHSKVILLSLVNLRTARTSTTSSHTFSLQFNLAPYASFQYPVDHTYIYTLSDSRPTMHSLPPPQLRLSIRSKYLGLSDEKETSVVSSIRGSVIRSVNSKEKEMNKNGNERGHHRLSVNEESSESEIEEQEAAEEESIIRTRRNEREEERTSSSPHDRYDSLHLDSDDEDEKKDYAVRSLNRTDSDDIRNKKKGTAKLSHLQIPSTPTTHRRQEENILDEESMTVADLRESSDLNRFFSSSSSRLSSNQRSQSTLTNLFKSTAPFREESSEDFFSDHSIERSSIIKQNVISPSPTPKSSLSTSKSTFSKKLNSPKHSSTITTSAVKSIVKSPPLFLTQPSFSSKPTAVKPSLHAILVNLSAEDKEENEKLYKKKMSTKLVFFFRSLVPSFLLQPTLLGNSYGVNINSSIFPISTIAALNQLPTSQNTSVNQYITAIEKECRSKDMNNRVLSNYYWYSLPIGSILLWRVLHITQAFYYETVQTSNHNSNKKKKSKKFDANVTYVCPRSWILNSLFSYVSTTLAENFNHCNFLLYISNLLTFCYYISYKQGENEDINSVVSIVVSETDPYTYSAPSPDHFDYNNRINDTVSDQEVKDNPGHTINTPLQYFSSQVYSLLVTSYTLLFSLLHNDLYTHLPVNKLLEPDNLERLDSVDILYDYLSDLNCWVADTNNFNKDVNLIICNWIIRVITYDIIKILIIALETQYKVAEDENHITSSDSSINSSNPSDGKVRRKSIFSIFRKSKSIPQNNHIEKEKAIMKPASTVPLFSSIASFSSIGMRLLMILSVIQEWWNKVYPPSTLSKKKKKKKSTHLTCLISLRSFAMFCVSNEINEIPLSCTTANQSLLLLSVWRKVKEKVTTNAMGSIRNNGLNGDLHAEDNTDAVILAIKKLKKLIKLNESSEDDNSTSDLDMGIFPSDVTIPIHFDITPFQASTVPFLPDLKETKLNEKEEKDRVFLLNMLNENDGLLIS